MNTPRAALALIVLAFLASSLPLGVTPARAQTVADAEDRAEQAASDRDSAYAVVSDAVANRSAVEAQLFDALNRYEQAVATLEAANRKLDRVGRTFAAAEADSVGVAQELRQQAVAAYMEAVVRPASLVVGTDTAEQAMVVDQAFTAGQTDNLARLDLLTVRQTDLQRLRTDFESDRDSVERLQAQLDAEAAQLEALFAEADSAVADAYRRAQAADEAYRSALSDVERARATATPPPQPPSTTATTASTAPTDPPPSEQPTTTTTTGPTTTDPPSEAPTIKPEVERWRSLVAAHFPADLVNDALLIMQCESLGDPSAVNPYSGASGLYQFLPGTWAVASVGAGYADVSVFDPEANIAGAAWLAGYYQANGSSPWAPWACRYYL